MQRFHSMRSRNGTDSERQTIAASPAVKPLPPLPRGWSRVCHETGLFLRGISLGFVVTFFQGIFTKNFLEPEKVAIRQSRVTALLRTLIHVVPLGVAVFELVLNLKGHFVGETFDKQSYLQFAAKAHEIAMQASIATILLSYIRYQISAGKGMPFGAVLSGLQFLQVSYLWSVELWSSILSKDFQLRKKICFAVLILICITVAATAGPSSASLLIARQGLWPLASTYISINASFLDVWPDRLDVEDIEKDCAMLRLHSLGDSSNCLSSDLYKTLLTGTNQDSGLDAPGFVSTIFIQDETLGFEAPFVFSRCQSSSKDQFCATVPAKPFMHGFYSVLLNNLKTNGTEGYQFGRKNYYQPYAVASCVNDDVKDVSDQALLQFARIPETDSELKKDREIVSIPGLTKAHIIEKVSGDNSDFRVDWVDLPMDIFNTGIPGAVIVNSQDLNGSSYSITTCTLNAGWGSSTLVSFSGQSNLVYSHMSNIPSSWPREKLPWDTHGYAYSDAPNFANISNFSYPQRHISVSKNWIESLNPTIILPDNSTRNFISLTLSLSQSRPREANVAQLLNLILANGIANTGREYDWEVFSDLKNATRTCETCLIFEIENSVYGWSYSARGTPTVLAITIMLAYCALVLGHIIYSAISGISSTAWDSTAEYVALAMNSSPTEILQNTCAGIIGRRAFKTPVRVLAKTPGHLELVFGEVKDPNAQASKLVVNQKYGKITVKKTTKMKIRSSMRRVRCGKGRVLRARNIRAAQKYVDSLGGLAVAAFYILLKGTSDGRLKERSDSNPQGSLRKRAFARSLE